MTNGWMDFLGRPACELLLTEPFASWHVVRSAESDAKPEIQYVFKAHGVELLCDAFDRVTAMFLHRGFDAEVPLDLGFDLSRDQVLTRLGRPSESGGATRIPGIGDCGAWDRFTQAQGIIHIQYSLGRDEIELITLMRPDTAPPLAKEAEQRLVITHIPSLVATLLTKERAKGSPLTRVEVERIRDDAPAQALTMEQRAAVDVRRQYEDIDPTNAWDEWQLARVELANAD